MSPLASVLGLVCVLAVGALLGASLLWWITMKVILREPAQFGAFMSNCLQSLALSSGQSHLHLRLGPETQVQTPDGRIAHCEVEWLVAVPVHSFCRALRNEMPAWIARSPGAGE